MKTKLFILMMTLIATSLPVMADPDPLLLKIHLNGPGDDNSNNGSQPFPKSPILVPVVYLDGHVLSFDESLEGCTVQLLDESENVIFADSIEENQTSVTFPGTLSGTYELQIICGGITFYCYIEL